MRVLYKTSLSIFLFIICFNLSCPTKSYAVSLPPGGQGVYESCAPASGQACLDNLTKIAQAGFKLVVNYSQLYGSAQQQIAYANYAHSLGLKIIWGLSNTALYNGNGYTQFSNLVADCNCSDRTSFITYFVNLVKNNPATYAYYIADEQDSSQQATLQSYYNLIHGIDPNHPAISAGTAINGPEEINAYYPASMVGTTDMFGIDYYPYGYIGATQNNTSAIDTTTSQIATALQTLSDTYSKPNFFVLQSFSWGGDGNPNWCPSPAPNCAYYPTEQQMQAQRDEVLTNSHPQFILWYSFFDTMNPNKIGANPTQHWNDLVQAAFAGATNITPTITPSIQLSISPQTTAISLTVCPHGLGKCGDNTNLTGAGNQQPKHTTRNVTISFINENNVQVGQQHGTVTYDKASGTFKGTIAENTIPTGTYLVSIKLDGYLPKQVPGIATLYQGEINTLPEASLVIGDINNDNTVDVLDYNILINCFSSKQQSSSCTNPPTSSSSGADINDDGIVDAVDYNLFLRELATQRGD